MKQLGLHIRVTDSIVTVAHQAIELSLPHFQSFLPMHAQTGKIKTPTDHEIMQFRKLCEKQFVHRYAHGSFWLNLADPAHSSVDGLWRQMLLAQRLGFTHLILHPGSSVRATKEAGIAMVAHTLNAIFKKERSIALILENTAHGNQAVGSRLEDLATIRTLLDKPDELTFCIDTAHAHAYGYTVTTPETMTLFLKQAEIILGIHAIALLHLNDASDMHGSYRDRHALLGAGTIGQAALYTAYHHAIARNLPIIIEPPIMTDIELKQLYTTVTTW